MTGSVHPQSSLVRVGRSHERALVPTSLQPQLRIGTLPGMPQSERRRTTLVQKLAVGLDISMIMTLLGLVFWLGQQSAKWDKAALAGEAQAATLEQMQSSVAQVQGQVLQMATSNKLAEAERRVSVLETRAGNTEQLVRDLRTDMIERLRRIENKVDHIKDTP